MKIRTDFVTNSSSSSFILSFKENEITDSIKKQVFDLCYGDDTISEQRDFFINQILNDIENNKTTLHEILKEAREEFESEAWYVFLRNSHYDFDKMESPEKDLFVKTYADEKIDLLKEMLSKDNVFAKLSYSDNDGHLFSCLEHNLVPNLVECKTTFSHH